jgi:hypothetical protein
MQGMLKEKRIELKNRDKQEVLTAIDEFLQSECWGRIGFEKEGESFSLWATSESEPMPT